MRFDIPPAFRTVWLDRIRATIASRLVISIFSPVDRTGVGRGTLRRNRMTHSSSTIPLRFSMIDSEEGMKGSEGRRRRQRALGHRIAATQAQLSRGIDTPGPKSSQRKGGVRHGRDEHKTRWHRRDRLLLPLQVHAFNGCEWRPLEQ